MIQPYLVAIGASAGGLTALYDFFDHTLPDGVSYVITMHLYPHQKSTLAELIRKHTDIVVCVVQNRMPVRANTIYVMPENQVMSILGGCLMLRPRDLSVKINWAIDLFFCSLAKDRTFQNIAVVLSGLGEDGTKGTAALAKTGAFIIVQEPASAGEKSMPASVIAAGQAHLVLSPKNMPQAIVDYVSGLPQTA